MEDGKRQSQYGKARIPFPMVHPDCQKEGDLGKEVGLSIKYKPSKIGAKRRDCIVCPDAKKNGKKVVKMKRKKDSRTTFGWTQPKGELKKGKGIKLPGR